jgi:hypothetical protein
MLCQSIILLVVSLEYFALILSHRANNLFRLVASDELTGNGKLICSELYIL